MHQDSYIGFRLPSYQPKYCNWFKTIPMYLKYCNRFLPIIKHSGILDYSSIFSATAVSITTGPRTHNGYGFHYILPHQQCMNKFDRILNKFCFNVHARGLKSRGKNVNKVAKSLFQDISNPPFRQTGHKYS